jgi:hypothetical protein
VEHVTNTLDQTEEGISWIEEQLRKPYIQHITSIPKFSRTLGHDQDSKPKIQWG